MLITAFNQTYNVNWSSFTWDNVYNFFGIKDFIYFISSPSIQDTLWPVKIVFIFFTLFFLCAVIWFYANSSYIQTHFLQDFTEMFSKETAESKKFIKSWKNIKARMDSGSDPQLRLAIIEADDLLNQTLQDADYQGDTFEAMVQSAAKKIPDDVQLVLQAHQVRNAIVYEPDFVLTKEAAATALDAYESAIKKLSEV